MAAVMEELDAARDKLLDDKDWLVGRHWRVKNVKEVEKRLRHRLLPRNAWQLIPFFELFMSSPKDGLHQWYVQLPHVCIDNHLSIPSIYFDVLSMY